MLLYKLKSKLNNSINHKDDILRLKAFLVIEDENLHSLSLYEIEGLWRMFSEDRGSGFINVSEKHIDDFLWEIKNKKED